MIELNQDFKKLQQHFNHPIYEKFVPTEQENECLETAWKKRYDKVYDELVTEKVK